MQSLIEQGLPKENLVHLNFMDERLPDLLQGEWNRIYEAYYGMYPHKRRAEKVVFLFDEMQDYPNWDLFIERMRRDENCDIYLTGSSSRLFSPGCCRPQQSTAPRSLASFVAQGYQPGGGFVLH